jgi:hypothetical protein
VKNSRAARVFSPDSSQAARVASATRITRCSEAAVVLALMAGAGIGLGQARLGPYVVDSNGLKVGHAHDSFSVLIFLGGQQRKLVTTRFFTSYDMRTVSTPDQVHACQMMTEVATVSIVAKNKYSAKAGGRPHPTRGGTKVRKPFTRVRKLPAMIFASRFALNGRNRHARIMAMGISIKTAEPIRAHRGRCGASDRFGEPTIANRAITSAYR